ncbi:MAG: WYL domain-containing protein [Ancrocorticia sp.]
MAKVHDIVRTHAILTYLASRPDGGASLGELSQHFKTPWNTVLKLLWDANLIEIPGMVAPFDLDLPDLPEQWDGEGEKPGPESLVWLGRSGSGEIPPLALTLDEAMVLLALLDNIVEVTPPGESREALLNLRSEITESAARAGFAQALWREPESPIAAESLETIVRCIDEHRTVNFSYHRAGPELREEVRDVVVVPVSISTGASPVLRTVSEGRVRSYRLDRIGAVSAGEAIARKDFTAARNLVRDEERAAAAATRRGEHSWQPKGESVTLHLTRAGKWAGETLPGAVVVEEGDTLRVTLPVTSEEWLFSLLLQLGDAVLAVEPRSIADRLARRFAQLLKET